jgi:hypothetical protein
MIDLEKLTPAPWTPAIESDRGYRGEEYGRFYFPTFEEVPFGFDVGLEQIAANDAEFIALARNAFDVMMRRGWTVVRRKGKWFVASVDENLVEKFKGRMMDSPANDPFTALVEANRWYEEHVEANQ